MATIRDAVQRVLATFTANRGSVDELVNLDRTLVELFLSGLRDLAAELRAKDKLHNASVRIENRVTALENVRRNDSLRRYYQTMFNQCVVLLVSYFASAVHDLFREGVRHAFDTSAEVNAATEEIKVSWKDFVVAGTAPSEIFAELLVTQKEISFQDMQSIARAFKTYFGLTIDRTSEVNDLIVAQAARHVIVHNGAIIDNRILKQLAAAKPRTLKPALVLGETLHFDPNEIALVGQRMQQYLANLATNLVELFPSEAPAA